MTDAEKKAIAAAALLAPGIAHLALAMGIDLERPVIRSRPGLVTLANAPGLAPPHLAVFREDGKWDSVVAEIAGPGDSVMEVSGSPSSVLACVERWGRTNEQQENQ